MKIGFIFDERLIINLRRSKNLCESRFIFISQYCLHDSYLLLTKTIKLVFSFFIDFVLRSYELICHLVNLVTDSIGLINLQSTKNERFLSLNSKDIQFCINLNNSSLVKQNSLRIVHRKIN